MAGREWGIQLVLRWQEKCGYFEFQVAFLEFLGDVVYGSLHAP